MTHLESARDVIKALGGIPAVAAITGRKTTTISKWQAKFGRFPASSYVLMKNEMDRRGLTAPTSLWFRESADA